MKYYPQIFSAHTGFGLFHLNTIMSIGEAGKNTIMSIGEAGKFRYLKEGCVDNYKYIFRLNLIDVGEFNGDGSVDMELLFNKAMNICIDFDGGDLLYFNKVRLSNSIFYIKTSSSTFTYPEESINHFLLWPKRATYNYNEMIIKEIIE